MKLQVIGAGLPRTGTASLKAALEHLLDGRCYHMSVVPGHPFDLGEAWNQAIAGGKTDWAQIFSGFAAAVDWPASMFWRELSEDNPSALILLSVRNSAETWLQSAEATFLPYARMALGPDWSEGRGLVALLERFAGTERWDDPATLMAAYDRHSIDVKRGVPQDRLLQWQASEGWAPICRALNRPVPKQPFPWTNRRGDWS